MYPAKRLDTYRIQQYERIRLDSRPVWRWIFKSNQVAYRSYGSSFEETRCRFWIFHERHLESVISICKNVDILVPLWMTSFICVNKWSNVFYVCFVVDVIIVVYISGGAFVFLQKIIRSKIPANVLTTIRNTRRHYYRIKNKTKQIINIIHQTFIIIVTFCHNAVKSIQWLSVTVSLWDDIKLLNCSIVKFGKANALSHW